MCRGPGKPTRVLLSVSRCELALWAVGSQQNSFVIVVVMTRVVVSEKEVWERRSQTKQKGRLHQAVRVK